MSDELGVDAVADVCVCVCDNDCDSDCEGRAEPDAEEGCIVADDAVLVGGLVVNAGCADVVDVDFDSTPVAVDETVSPTTERPVGASMLVLSAKTVSRSIVLPLVSILTS